jgi:hypothetical protein
MQQTGDSISSSSAIKTPIKQRYESFALAGTRIDLFIFRRYGKWKAKR